MRERGARGEFGHVFRVFLCCFDFWGCANGRCDVFVEQGPELVIRRFITLHGSFPGKAVLSIGRTVCQSWVVSWPSKQIPDRPDGAYLAATANIWRFLFATGIDRPALLLFSNYRCNLLGWDSPLPASGPHVSLVLDRRPPKAERGW